MRRVVQHTALVRTVVTASVAAATLVTSTLPATASAVGYGKVGSFCYTVKSVELCAPGATIGHVIRGSGRTITREEASVRDIFGGDSAGGRWCNWRIDWHYSDTEGRTYHTSRGTIHHSCTSMTSVGRIDTTRHTLRHYGKACAVFFAGGAKRGSQCHHIVK